MKHIVKQPHASRAHQGHAMSSASPAPRHFASLQQLLVPTGAAFIAVLLARCNDKAPVVRAKATAALAAWLSSWASHPAGMASRDLARCLHLAVELRLDERNTSRGGATGEGGPRGTPLTGASSEGPAHGVCGMGVLLWDAGGVTIHNKYTTCSG